ncbi:aminoacyl-histidine dipeptidase [Cellulophaga lytica]|uniref:Cytosol non-specific dipeptidase n=1 Tax=Cellulophaga lytica (strain ATCC 23178 / DSM 7489 / JCM 8516 / NBRC 14961 / NCIMB 1423 / VKM B-1433 / Cy l20) TaxID=867900 RepID=F0RH67_CELLC|nr:aminoacyl-histidine dipeptidase [Cellulophaga lytica]ADY28105.1 aminoacyl-histidine dipeptidase [Cellulophaga lytica DSM 7489]AIM59180.1 aminoacyl-histidine dipeptidase [Cellulophaga lytica]WQG77709.1 aminoacyl-histidine dipeptidase [Cellulophaga lytica]
MSKDIRELEPKAVWNKFADLNAVPRPSKKEERVIQFMLDFGASLQLETLKDEVGNVIIRKPATPGLENKKMVTLQSHLDMVHQKNNDTVFDFDTQGIQMYIDGDWVRAQGTTLGADNGMGVATIMALLESTDIPHPALEALFTIDEETGMTGAMGLKGGVLQGDILLNLDTEEDDEIDIGCAGGVDITARRIYELEPVQANFTGYKVTVKGLNGGHSGMDIHRGLGNANKIMNRLLYNISLHTDLAISEIDGGSLRNAIPRESNAIVAVKVTDEFLANFEKLVNTIKSELKVTEPNLIISLTEVALPENVMEKEAQQKMLRGIYTAHNGVYAMSASMADLVETSNNIARVIVKDGAIKIGCLTRSSVNSGKMDLANALKSAFELADFKVDFSGEYPGWNPNPDSAILKVLSAQYKTVFGTDAKVVACHAGLECGILGQNYPDMDMISFGPTIKGAHSPDERVSISSVQKFWKFTLEVLKNSPA